MRGRCVAKVEKSSLAESGAGAERLEAERSVAWVAALHFWRFLNSSLGLFVLSSGLLTGGGRLYSQWQAQQQMAMVRRADMSRLLVELDVRTVEISVIRARVLKGAPSGPAPLAELKDIIAGGGSYRASAPEFQGVHTLALLSRTDLVAGDMLSQEISISRQAASKRGWMRLETPRNAAFGIEAAPSIADVDFHLTVLSHYVDQRREAFLREFGAGSVRFTQHDKARAAAARPPA